MRCRVNYCEWIDWLIESIFSAAGKSWCQRHFWCCRNCVLFTQVFLSLMQRTVHFSRTSVYFLFCSISDRGAANYLVGHLTIGIGRLFVLVSKTTKMLLTAVHIDDNEVTNDSVISHVSSSKNYKLVKLWLECYQSTIVPFTIVTMWLLLNADVSWNKKSVIGRLFGADNRLADNRSKHYRCTSK